MLSFFKNTAKQDWLITLFGTNISVQLFCQNNIAVIQGVSDKK